MALVCSIPTDERCILETPVSQAECRRLLEAAEKEVSRSFLCLWFVVSQSVMQVELFVYLAEQNALL